MEFNSFKKYSFGTGKDKDKTAARHYHSLLLFIRRSSMDLILFPYEERASRRVRVNGLNIVLLAHGAVRLGQLK